MDLRLVDYWAPRVRAALESALTPAQLRGAAEAAHRAREAGLDPAEAASAHLFPMFDTTALKAVLADMTADAWAVGGAAAARQLTHPGEMVKAEGDGVAVPPASEPVDWDNWQPGDIGAASAVADGGLADLLDTAGVSIGGITGSALDALGNQIGDGLVHGLGVDEVADSLGGWATDARAERIAHTETARAVSAATLDTYAANGIGSWNLVLADGACQECQNVADGGPYPADDTNDAPPIHPYCRCSASPTAEDADQFAQELLQGAGIGDEVTADTSEGSDDGSDEGVGAALAGLAGAFGVGLTAGGLFATDEDQAPELEANLAGNLTVLSEERAVDTVGSNADFGRVTRAETELGILPTDTETDRGPMGGPGAVDAALVGDIDSREEDDALAAGQDAAAEWVHEGRPADRKPVNPFGANQADLADLWEQGFLSESSGTGLVGETADIAAEAEDVTSMFDAPVTLEVEHEDTAPIPAAATDDGTEDDNTTGD